MDNTADINYFKDPLNGKTGETAFKEKLPSILESHENELKKKLIFNTISDAQSYSGFVTGDTIEVLGYYAKGDGGEHKRVKNIIGSQYEWTILSDVYNVKYFGAKGDGVQNDHPFIQECINQANLNKKNVIYFPSANYLLNSFLENFDYLEIAGDNFGATNGATSTSSCITINNPDSAFKCASVKKFKINNISFRAGTNGYASAVVLNQTERNFYSERCDFRNISVWGNLRGGFLGNFILTEWENIEFGFLGDNTTEFYAIKSIGNVAGNQTNANVCKNLYILHTIGSDALLFSAGTNVKFDNIRFEQCNSERVIRCKGIFVTDVVNLYLEACVTDVPIEFMNEDTNSQGCSVINIENSYMYMHTTNNYLIKATGAFGGINFNKNRVDGMAGKNLTNTSVGTNKGIKSYIGNITPSFELVNENIYLETKTFTPKIFTDGGNAHTYSVQSGRYTVIGNLCFVNFRITLSAKDATSEGFVKILLDGLPPCKNNVSEGYAGNVFYFSGVNIGTAIQVGISVNESNKIGIVKSYQDGTIANLATSEITNSFTLVGSVAYEV